MRIIFLEAVFMIHFSFAINMEQILELAATEVEHMDNMKSVKVSVRDRITETSIKLTKRNAIAREAVKIVRSLESVDKKEAKELVRTALMKKAHSMDRNAGSDECPKSMPTCNFDSIYRNIDGSCNNEDNPHWGSAKMPFKRLVIPHYQDGEGEPRGGDGFSNKANATNCFIYNGTCSTNSSPYLPNPRYVSIVFDPPNNVSAAVATHMFTVFGQFLDHDIDLTPMTNVQNCCQNNCQEGCFAINIFPGLDTFYPQVPRTCLEVQRSLPWCEEVMDTREQVNDITAFIDASNVYGSDTTLASALRTHQDGKLKTTDVGGFEMLPILNGEHRAGDSRALVTPGLSALHTLFVREHNSIAKQLSENMSSLPDMPTDTTSAVNDDEDLYQRARRIVIAEMQNIVYDEYLPVLFGNQTSLTNKFVLKSDRGQTNYRKNVNPTVSNVFATAAFRFGHSMIQDVVLLINAVTNARSSFRTREEYFEIRRNLEDNGRGTQNILLGHTEQPSQDMDRFFVEDTNNFLFNESVKFGHDLVARNIQRGRDHGLPGYNEWREYCDLGRYCSWGDDHDDISNENWNILQALYEEPSDIDIFVAGIAEYPIDGGITGPTFSCLLAKQFQDLMLGDRYFFTHRNQAGTFTKDQLETLRKRTLADVICDNTEIETIKEKVFEENSETKLCSEANYIDFSLF